MCKPQDHALWSAFEEWAEDRGVDTKRIENNWQSHWECFKSGATAFIQLQSKRMLSDFPYRENG